MVKGPLTSAMAKEEITRQMHEGREEKEWIRWKIGTFSLVFVRVGAIYCSSLSLSSTETEKMNFNGGVLGDY